MRLKTSELIKGDDILTSDLEDNEELQKLFDEAETFLMNHKWCEKIKNGWLDRGWGYMLGVFVFEVEMIGNDVDDYVWVVVGDIPSAYIDVHSAKNGAQAIEEYLNLLNDWIESLSSKNSTEDCYPFNIPNEKKYIPELKKRISLIKTEILNEYQDELNSSDADIIID